MEPTVTKDAPPPPESAETVAPDAPGFEMRRKVAVLEERRAKARELGGGKRIARQHGRGKMTARERIDSLADEGSFLELGIQASEYETPNIPADGVITGVGKIDGRMTCIAAYDFTVLGDT